MAFESPSAANARAHPHLHQLHDHFDPGHALQSPDTHYASSPDYEYPTTATTAASTTATSFVNSSTAVSSVVSPTSPPFTTGTGTANPSLPNSRAARSQSVATQSSVVSGQSIRRKPLSSTASPLAIRYSTRDQVAALQDLPKPDTRFSRAFSVDSPTLYNFPHRHSEEDERVVEPLKSLTKGPANQQQTAVASPEIAHVPRPNIRETILATAVLVPEHIPEDHPAASQTSPQHEDLTTHISNPASSEKQSVDVDDLESPVLDNPNSNQTMSVFARKPSPPHLTLAPHTGARATAPPTNDNKADTSKPLPKSPASSKLGTFFGWASTPSSATFSDKGFSPIPSPYSPRPTTVFADDSPDSATGTITDKAHAEHNSIAYCEGYLQTPPTTTPTPPTIQIEEMEDELKAISAELASSIRREMDLEDLVDRLQGEISNPQAPSKRTSDYFSDSGYSSAKFSDYDASKEEVAQIQRRAEQEKAQIRLELTEKLSDERTKRKVLDQQIRELAQKASTFDLAQARSQDATGRVKELENSCEDLRRRLGEERQVKNNFEDLLSALKGELQNAANERDNLRDEIVPQLRARVEGLEAQATEHAKLTYDTTKIQQELQTLKMENTSLKNSRQEDVRMSLSRSKSNSVTSASGSGFKLSQPPLGRSNTVKQTDSGLKRSNTVKTTESRDALAERLKDVEAQRDALHAALKNLLDRQEFQNRENEKKVRVLEGERDRLLTSSPKKAGYEREVTNLREEIATLRRRAEEAIEQKWQVEKGLGGLKMDLDRAEEEIAGLRDLLKEKDILIPAAFARSSGDSTGSSRSLGVPVTSASLDKAYKELQQAYAEALEKIRSLELGSATTSASQDEKTQLAMQRLEQSLSISISERDTARQEASDSKAQLTNLLQAEKGHLETERDLASQLHESARRVEELAQQVRSQLATNADLRSRLSQTVARGEAEQKASKDRIASMQVRLKGFEDKLVAVQTAAEERVARHEEEVASLKEAHNDQLRRFRDSAGLRSPRMFPPKSPMSPMFANSVKSPRLSPRPSPRRSTTMPGGGSPVEGDAEQLGQVASLKARVADLEGALAVADAEMQDVVGRMNTAQIEVLQLQEEREAAARDTRKLQRQLEEEKIKAFQERFQTLSN